jgi:hypothetical protein
MSQDDEATFLDGIQANNHRALYQARWDAAAAAEVVPKLISLLDSDDRDTLLRVLNAFVTIGPEAHASAPKIARHLKSPDILVYQSATIALSCVSYRNPGSAVQLLFEAGNVPGREKYAMHALIGFGAAAASAYPLFVRCFGDRSAKIRRLALRGLVAIDASEQILVEIFRKAANDKSKAVREYAAMISRRSTNRNDV